MLCVPEDLSFQRLDTISNSCVISLQVYWGAVMEQHLESCPDSLYSTTFQLRTLGSLGQWPAQLSQTKTRTVSQMMTGPRQIANLLRIQNLKVHRQDFQSYGFISRYFFCDTRSVTAKELTSQKIPQYITVSLLFSSLLFYSPLFSFLFSFLFSLLFSLLFSTPLLFSS